MRRAVLSIFAILIATFCSAQVITGRIIDKDHNVIPFVNIGIEGSSIGTSSNEEGYFSLLIGKGPQTLSFSAIGYNKFRYSFTVEGDIRIPDITMDSNSLGLNEVVVTGTQFEVHLKSSPVKVEVITSDYLQKNFAPTNLVEGISMINGVQEVVACGVCYTNSISINGLPGAYTAILMDGSPIYGNLAATYGLNGIPTSIVDRFEVIKGPSSTLYGSEAVAGVINIITKDPSEHPLLSLDIMGTSHLESFGNIAFSPNTEKNKGYIGLNYAYINDFDDENKDGFGDNASLDRVSLFTKWDIFRSSGRAFSIAGKLYYEDRRNGVENFLTNRAYRDLRGSDQIYGESILTYRSELFGNYELSDRLKLDFSMSHHVQDSYYGADSYFAKQSILFTNFTWRNEWDNHKLLIGSTLKQQLYDDNTIATLLLDGTNSPDNQFVPGVFVQNEWLLSKKVSLLGGLRADYQSIHGVEWSPRFSIKYNPATYTTLRLNSGTGFKLVNLFTEDHAFVTGQRQVEIEEKLEPEESVNVTLNVNHVYALGESQGMLDVDFYYTYFSNKIIPDYDTPGKILYRNIDGSATTRGVSINLTHQWSNGLGIVMGGNRQEVFEKISGDKNSIPFAPKWSGVMTVNYLLKKQGITIAYTSNVTGPMELPLVFDLSDNGIPGTNPRPTASKVFSIHNIQLTKEIDSEKALYFGIQNFLNYRQSASPLVGYNDPNFSSGFSPYFDTSYSFSPLHGREFYMGFRWSPGK